jgi:hypothetical protein
LGPDRVFLSLPKKLFLNKHQKSEPANRRASQPGQKSRKQPILAILLSSRATICVAAAFWPSFLFAGKFAFDHKNPSKVIEQWRI